MILNGINWLIVGLGNPGSEYEGTRHNIGKDIVGRFKKRFETFDNVEVLVPDTYMNLSGGPVAKALGKDKQERRANAQYLIVVHDDIDLPFGDVKVSKARGSGGQKGVEDIVKAIGTKDFVRVRIGVTPVFLGKQRKPRGSRAVSSFVLKKFGILERKEISNIFDRVSRVVEEIVKYGVDSAMNKFN